MTKYHVDLGDPPAEEMPPPPGKLGRARAFETFKSLKKAVRWATHEYEEGRLRERVILDDNGDPMLNIDWNGTEWMTREELAAKLARAEAAFESQRDRANKMQEEAAKRDNDMIRAGYIPVRALAPHLVDIVTYRDGGGAHSDFFPRDFGAMPLHVQTTYKLEFRQHADRVGAEQHPFVTAMQAIAERIIR